MKLTKDFKQQLTSALILKTFASEHALLRDEQKYIIDLLEDNMPKELKDKVKNHPLLSECLRVTQNIYLSTYRTELTLYMPRIYTEYLKRTCGTKDWTMPKELDEAVPKVEKKLNRLFVKEHNLREDVFSYLNSISTDKRLKDEFPEAYEEAIKLEENALTPSVAITAKIINGELVIKNHRRK